MTTRSKGATSPLVEAAEALDEQLNRFEELTRSAVKLPLTSQKNLARAVELIKDISDVESELQGRVSGLISAINDARDRQQEQAARIVARAEELRARSEAYQKLLDRSGDLGREAAEINTVLVEASGSANGPLKADASIALDEAQTRIAKVIAGADELQKLAEEADFPDVGRLADSLRKQLIAARGKLKLVQQRVAN